MKIKIIYKIDNVYQLKFVSIYKEFVTIFMKIEKKCYLLNMILTNYDNVC